MLPTPTICICGAGTMGTGIAQVAAVSGFFTTLFDVNAPALQTSEVSIETRLQALSDKGRMSAHERQACLERLNFTDQVKDCTANIIIEAILEQKETKISLFHQLAAVNTPETIFATNTSSVSVTAIAAEVSYPGRLAGMHFFNPAPVMKLVEVVKTIHTEEHVISSLVSLALAMGKTPVVCKDAPGFIVNRVARPYYLEAMKMIESGIAAIETVDAIMEATGFKMGPFQLMDLIGLDINYSVSNSIWQALHKPERLTPSPIQKAKVDAGELGRKTGKGFYQVKSKK